VKEGTTHRGGKRLTAVKAAKHPGGQTQEQGDDSVYTDYQEHRGKKRKRMSQPDDRTASTTGRKWLTDQVYAGG